MNSNKIKTGQLGKSGLNISELGFGAGGFWGMKIFNERVAKDLFDIAIDHGVNFFDTGPNYSGGNAEARLGKLLGSRNTEVYIGTKCGTHLVNGRHVKDYSKTGLRKSFETSLKRLGWDYVELLQLHDMPAPLEQQTIEFLLEAKLRGETKLLGVSTGVAGAEQALEAGIFDSEMI
jgi:aryl-alcohol dehydrogenase-like predicted oxidoreductase